MTSTATAHLPLPHLKASATKSHAFPKLASGSLLSVGQICDNACTAIFNSRSVHMYRNQDITVIPSRPPLISGTRNMPSEPLYNIQLPTPSSQLLAANSMTTKIPHLNDRIAFYHAALFSPVLSTWTHAINAGYLDSWPELTAKQVNQYAPRSEATTMGHMHAQRSNIRSTKPTSPAPTPAASSQRTHHVYTDC
jgi:hypothetical protein